MDRIPDLSLPRGTPSSVTRAAESLGERVQYLRPEETEQLRRALLFAIRAHAKQKRADGSPYIVHPIAVTGIIAELKLDLETLIAGLLHDTVEDCPEITCDTIEKKFGEHVAFLVNAVTKLEEYDKRAEGTQHQPQNAQDKNAQYANLQYLMLSSARDLRSLIIKLADRLHNMRTLGSLPALKQQRIAQETMEVYVPLSSILGMRNWKIELETLAFSILHSEDDRHIREHLDSIKTQANDMLVQEICDEFKRLLDQDGIPYQQIYGRLKTPASIFRKSRAKSLNLKDLMDIMAFRIILKSRRHCYWVLGKLHDKFRHVAGTFDDYISAPKSNGYESLHTVIFGPRRMRIEIQIRSVMMDEIAERGIAAHWRYKNDLKISEEASNLVAQLQEDITEEKMKRIIMGEINLNHFSKEVIVYTPKGGLVRLPDNSTVLDFAFRIHSELGLHFREAQVNGVPVSIGQRLNRGDTVDIFTDHNIRPQNFWLEHVKTHRARAAIRQSLDIQEAAELTLYLSELADQYHQELTTTIDYLTMRQLYSRFNVQDINELDDALLSARIKPQDILNAVQADIMPVDDKLGRQKRAIAMIQQVISCPHCLPLPGDQLQGIWQVDKGLVAHREGCPKLALYINHNRPVETVELEKRRSGKTKKFLTILDCQIPNRPGLMGAICVTLGERKINIEDLGILSKSRETLCIRFYVSVQHKLQIDDVIETLRRRNLGVIATRPMIEDLYQAQPSPIGTELYPPHNDD